MPGATCSGFDIIKRAAMKNEDHTDEEASPDGGGRVARWRRSLGVVGLRIVDAASGFLERLRTRIDSSSEIRDAREDGKGKARSQPDKTDGSEAPAPPKPRRLVYVLAFTLTLAIGVAAGGAYSYHLLSKTISSHSTTVERLRDTLADMKKEASLDTKELANCQRTISAYDKGVVRYLKEIEDCKAESEELHGQLSAARSTANASRTGSTSRDRRDSRGSQTAAAPSQQARSPRAGTCVTDPANIAASLEKCVEEFNRK
jgi:hypothetical protein